MKLKLLIGMLLFASFYRDLPAQDTEKMIKEAKKQILENKELDPKLKKEVMDLLNAGEAAQAVSSPDAKLEPPETLRSLPSPDHRRLATIPAHTLSRQELHLALSGMIKKIGPQLEAGERDQVQRIVERAGGSGVYLATEAVSAWYNGRPRMALLLTARAALLSGNVLALNNLGAMLNLCGLEEKAVPLLRFALQADSLNSMVLNNLGRAYLGLGAKEKAEEVYLACVRQAPGHPEAHNALGCLYNEAGDAGKAAEHFEQSLEGAYNENAARNLDGVSPGYQLAFYVSRHHRPPETFNQFKFQIPEECSGTTDYNKVQAMHTAFQKGIENLKDRYAAMARSIGEKGERDASMMQRRIMEGIQRREIPVFGMSPFARLAGSMTLSLQQYYLEELTRFRKDYERDIHELDVKYAHALEEAKERVLQGNKYGTQGEFTGCLNCQDLDERICKAQRDVSNGFQKDAASFHRQFVDKYRLALTGYYDQLVYWNYLTGLPGALQDAKFYQAITGFLDEILYLSRTTPLWAAPGICDENVPFAAREKKYEADLKPKCPINISIPFVVGKLSMDCSSFSLSGGEGVTGSYKKNFVTGQSTLSIGAGLTLEIGGAGVAAGVSASESIYVTFDKNGNPTDAGLKFDAGGKLKLGNISTGSGAGYTMGMNSGWDFTANAAGSVVKL